jgi:hypothetical protein
MILSFRNPLWLPHDIICFLFFVICNFFFFTKLETKVWGFWRLDDSISEIISKTTNGTSCLHFGCTSPFIFLCVCVCLCMCVRAWWLELCRRFPVNVDVEPPPVTPHSKPFRASQPHGCIYMTQYICIDLLSVCAQCQSAGVACSRLSVSYSNH